VTGAAIDRAVEGVAGPGALTVATLWATVDIERTLADHGVEASELGFDPFLGARVVLVLILSELPNSPVAIAEPTTEGRLAATLARHGEGPAGRYVAVADSLDLATTRAAASGTAVSRVEPGPFGRSMLVLLGPVTGPHLILCDPAVPSTP
jgi:hypothetical protein